ncbi:TMEM175 family protein [Raoultibacter massiliensis]|uniref:TMEM175 family protein n=1 Tax=Raoultibacter massiliensis TaxID=1852371 RepID=A0ABV1JAS0_9ACTN|nr:TMEM175 family protein [Raoultibacter massiliensis]
MSKSRLEAFTDAVIAIVMTILVLELHEPTAGSFAALFEEWHRLVIYVVSFLMLAIYWNNHHHMFQAAKAINGKVLWANNLFILSLSVFPFVTSWMGDYFSDLAPQLSFGIAIMMADVMFFAVAFNLKKATDDNETVSIFFNKYYKSWISIGVNVVALLLGMLIRPELIFILNALMLALWVVPERRIERVFQQHR